MVASKCNDKVANEAVSEEGSHSASGTDQNPIDLSQDDGADEDVVVEDGDVDDLSRQTGQMSMSVDEVAQAQPDDVEMQDEQEEQLFDV